uniref:Uncharacterized protein n=1 Tax=Chromera velia CCMP2878 TaxID=1169474 RepID=A0A0G4HAD5_9ALVE|eukprot:Cvel_6035.t1-p1 / transcript=Cvel_6035.t1 / gene=Cvel_6035 / organism=Chromera_velia_CCMP2878 / gene_product=hypothetical protein / transcript_product=hypothetical protein / location=Cvel_scaffold289:87383-90471(+) / protein_length=563 / sequence_SO=supercontig / SO=protein_coding / is_pseudo=false
MEDTVTFRGSSSIGLAFRIEKTEECADHMIILTDQETPPQNLVDWQARVGESQSRRTRDVVIWVNCDKLMASIPGGMAESGCPIRDGPNDIYIDLQSSRLRLKVGGCELNPQFNVPIGMDANQPMNFFLGKMGSLTASRNPDGAWVQDTRPVPEVARFLLMSRLDRGTLPKMRDGFCQLLDSDFEGENGLDCSGVITCPTNDMDCDSNPPGMLCDGVTEGFYDPSALQAPKWSVSEDSGNTNMTVKEAICTDGLCSVFADHENLVVWGARPAGRANSFERPPAVFNEVLPAAVELTITAMRKNECDNHIVVLSSTSASASASAPAAEEEEADSTGDAPAEEVEPIPTAAPAEEEEESEAPGSAPSTSPAPASDYIGVPAGTWVLRMECGSLKVTTSTDTIDLSDLAEECGFNETSVVNSCPLGFTDTGSGCVTTEVSTVSAFRVATGIGLDYQCPLGSTMSGRRGAVGFVRRNPFTTSVPQCTKTETTYAAYTQAARYDDLRTVVWKFNPCSSKLTVSIPNCASREVGTFREAAVGGWRLRLGADSDSLNNPAEFTGLSIREL